MNTLEYVVRQLGLKQIPYYCVNNGEKYIINSYYTDIRVSFERKCFLHSFDVVVTSNFTAGKTKGHLTSVIDSSRSFDVKPKKEIGTTYYEYKDGIIEYISLCKDKERLYYLYKKYVDVPNNYDLSGYVASLSEVEVNDRIKMFEDIEKKFEGERFLISLKSN